MNTFATLLGKSLLPAALVFCAFTAVKISNDLGKKVDDGIALIETTKAEIPRIAAEAGQAAGKEGGKGFVQGAGAEVAVGAATVSAVSVAGPAVLLVPQKNVSKARAWIHKHL